MYFKLYLLVVAVTLMFSSTVGAVILGPISPGGSIGFLGQYNKSSSGEVSSSRSITLRGDANSYIWQPWFISWSGSLGLVATDQGSSGDASSRSINGSVSLNVLPRSRFPLILGYSVGSSRTEYQINSDSAGRISSDREVRTESFSAYQTYSAWGGTHYAAWYTLNSYDSPVSDGQAKMWGEDSSRGLTASRRFELHSLEMMLSESQSRSAGLSASRKAASLSHNYSPESEFGVSSGLTFDENSNSETAITVNSRFFWRPEYSDFSVNGSIGAGESVSGSDAASRSINAQMSGGYRLSRSVRATAGVSVSLTEADTGRSGSSSQNIGLTYSSDRSLLGKFTWGWNAGAGMSNTVSRGDQGNQSNGSMNVSLGHSGNRQVKLSDRSMIGVSLSQSGGASKLISDNGGVQRSLAHSGSINYRHSGEGGTTSIWSSLNDNRDLESGSSQQGFQVNLSRDQRVSRTSGLTGNLSYSYAQSYDPDSADGGRSSNSSSSGFMSYRDGRFLGVHRLVFKSDLKLSEAGGAEAGLSLSSAWSNQVSYQLGLLSASLSASYAHRSGTSGVDQRYMFSVTRSL